MITSSFAILPFTVVWRVTAAAPWIVTSCEISVALPALSVTVTISVALAVPLAGAAGMSAAGTVTFHSEPTVWLMGTALPFQVADSVVSASADEPRKVTSFFAASAVMICALPNVEKCGSGGVLSTVNVRVSGLEAVPPGEVAMAVTVCVKLSAKLLMSMFGTLHLP